MTTSRGNQERPWTEKYWQEHPPFGKEVPPIVEPIRAADWMWFRGDRVELLKGPDKGKQVQRGEGQGGAAEGTGQGQAVVTGWSCSRDRTKASRYTS